MKLGIIGKFVDRHLKDKATKKFPGIERLW